MRGDISLWTFHCFYIKLEHREIHQLISLTNNYCCCLAGSLPTSKHMPFCTITTTIIKMRLAGIYILLAALHVLFDSDSTLTTTPWGRYYCSLQFTDEETGALRSQVTCPSSTTSKSWSCDSNPAGLTLEFILFFRCQLYPKVVEAQRPSR